MPDLIFVGLLTFVFIVLYLLVPDDVRRAEYNRTARKCGKKKYLFFPKRIPRYLGNRIRKM